MECMVCSNLLSHVALWPVADVQDRFNYLKRSRELYQNIRMDENVAGIDAQIAYFQSIHAEKLGADKETPKTKGGVLWSHGATADFILYDS